MFKLLLNFVVFSVVFSKPICVNEDDEDDENDEDEDDEEVFYIPYGTRSVNSRSWNKWGVDIKKLKNVIIPTSVTDIGGCAFTGCSSLVSVVIPSSVTYIEPYTFKGCTSLKHIDIPLSVTEIRGRAFEGCSSLASVVIPSSLTYIRVYAFEGCSSLTTLVIDSSGVQHLEETSFYQLPLAQITMILAPDHIIKALGGPFNDYKTLAEVPQSMRAVPDATTYAAGALYLWWSDPQQDACEGRVLSTSRQQMVWTVMHVALRLETDQPDADVLPPEMWMLIMTFVKHDQPPM